MANTLTNWTPKIWAQGLGPLRQNAKFVQSVRVESAMANAERGAVLTFPKSVAATVRAITPAVYAATNQDITATQATVTLGSWYEATYQMSDKDEREIVDGHLPLQAQECFKAIANQIDNEIQFAMYTKAEATCIGTPATTPFVATSSLVNLASCRQRLNENLAPQEDRFLALDPVAEGVLTVMPDVLRFDGAGTGLSLMEGLTGRKLGFNVYLDQNIVTITAATTAWATGYSVLTAGAAAGATAVSLINATQGGTINAGQVFIFNASQYVVVSATTTSATNTAVTISFTPPLKTAVVSGDAVTLVAAAVHNLYYQRSAVIFASRLLAPSLGAQENTSSIVDPVTGIALKVGITREYYQSTFRVSALWGVSVVRPTLVGRLFG